MSSKLFSSTHKNTHYRPDIDGLRGIAVILVVLFHAFPKVIQGGFIGVDIFFVISGFLISNIVFKSLENSTFNFYTFYARRIRRIFPALIVVLFFSILFGYFVLFADEYRQLGKHILGASIFISNLILWKEHGYFDNASETKPLLHLWSLGIEEQYYILFPFFLYFIYKIGLHKKILHILIFLVLASFLFNLYLISKRPIEAFYNPLCRFWELLMGVGLSYISINKNNKNIQRDILTNFFLFQKVSFKNKEVQGVLALTLLGGGLAFITKQSLFPGYWALLPAFATVLLIASHKEKTLSHKILTLRIFTGIGLISYPLYLWHWPLLSFAQIIESGVPNLTIRSVALGLSFILAILTYLFIERPIRFGVFSLQNKTIIFLCLCLLGLGLGGGIVLQNKGLKDRKANKLVLNHNLGYEKKYEYGGEDCNKILGMNWIDMWCNGGISKFKNPKFLFVGDSFIISSGGIVGHLMEKYSTHIEFSSIGMGQCPGLIIDKLDEKDICLQFGRRSLDFINNNPSISTIIFTGEWYKYFGKSLLYSEPANKKKYETYVSSIEKTIKYYQKLGKKIYFILSNPIGGNIQTCSKRIFTFTKDYNCQLPTLQAIQYEDGYRETLVPILKKLGISYIDPLGAFCNDANCKLINEGYLLYTDPNHLSEAGGAFLAKYFEKEFMEIFNLTH